MKIKSRCFSFVNETFPYYLMNEELRVRVSAFLAGICIFKNSPGCRRLVRASFRLWNRSMENMIPLVSPAVTPLEIVEPNACAFVYTRVDVKISSALQHVLHVSWRIRYSWRVAYINAIPLYRTISFSVRRNIVVYPIVAFFQRWGRWKFDDGEISIPTSYRTYLWSDTKEMINWYRLYSRRKF